MKGEVNKDLENEVLHSVVCIHVQYRDLHSSSVHLSALKGHKFNLHATQFPKHARREGGNGGRKEGSYAIEMESYPGSWLQIPFLLLGKYGSLSTTGQRQMQFLVRSSKSNNCVERKGGEKKEGTLQYTCSSLPPNVHVFICV